MSAALLGLLAVGALSAGVGGLALLRAPSPAVRRLDLPGAQRPSAVLRARQALGRRLAPAVLRATSDRRRRRLEHDLLAAGRPDRMTLADVAAVKGADLVVCTAIGIGATTISPWLLPVVAAYGFVREDLRLRRLATARQTRIERDLPDYLDVLVVTVHAGLKLRAAMRRVNEQLDSPVSEELRTALQQIDLGASRRDAFEGVRARTTSPSLTRFVGALLQAEELGSPLADVMAAIAEDVRKAHGQQVRRQAAQAVPRVTLVATLLLMPGAALLLLAGLFIGSGLDLGAALGG